MSIDGLELPPGGATEDWLREMNALEDVEIIVPLTIEEEEIHWVIGASVVTQESIVMLYFTLDSWKVFTRYSLRNDFSIYDDDLLYPNVSLRGVDARNIRKLATKFGEKIQEEMLMGFVPYVKGPNAGEKFESAREKCDCNSLSESRVRAGPGLSGIDTERVYFCIECMEAHGIEYNGRPVKKEKVYDANWVLASEFPDGLIELDEKDSYLLYSSGTPAQRLEHAVALMSTDGGGISHSFSRYLPDEHQVLVCVRDDTLTGYLTWTDEFDGRPALQQLFTRSGFRKEGVASTIIDAWVNRYCDSDVFYVEEPNEKSRSLFEKLGYWKADTPPKAVEHYVLRGVGNDWEEGMNAANSVTNFMKS